MRTCKRFMNPKRSACLAAVAAYGALAGPALASAPEVTVKVTVSAAGVTLAEPAGVRALYGRLRQAARLVCGRGDRVGLEPAKDFAGCYEKALGDAVRSVNRPELTMVYMGDRASLASKLPS